MDVDVWGAVYFTAASCSSQETTQFVDVSRWISWLVTSSPCGLSCRRLRAWRVRPWRSSGRDREQFQTAQRLQGLRDSRGAQASSLLKVREADEGLRGCRLQFYTH